MRPTNLKPNEEAELQFLRYMDAMAAAFCSETENALARKMAADFAAKQWPRLQALSAKEASVVESNFLPDEELMAQAAAQQPGGAAQ